MIEKSPNAGDSNRGFRPTLCVSQSSKTTHKKQKSVDLTSSESEIESVTEEIHKNALKSPASQKTKRTKTKVLPDSKQKVGDTSKKRYILFLGNLPHSASHDDIIEHFSKRGVPVMDLRLLTDRESGKSKGCAFAEFSNNKQMQNAIKFHRSKLQGRTINVEVTCGGGGKGDKRQKKIRERNRTMRRVKTVKSGKTVRH